MPSDKWMITSNEAFEMFARHFEARHRSGAVGRAQQRAQSLKVKGDYVGDKIWTEIAARIETLRNQEMLTARRAKEHT
jgi:hypothetical protein